MMRLTRHTTRQRLRGQSLVEFALVMPVLLLLLLIGIDFGRIYLGWINLNNTARIAANYAASNATLINAGNANAIASYNRIVSNDATAINCTLQSPLPLPTFTPDTALGSDATAQISCSFGVITPVISSVLGSVVTVSSSAVFPIRGGIVAGIPGGGPAAVVANFDIDRSGGDAPLPVAFTNTSTGSPTSYAWDFDEDSVVDSIAPSPGSFTYSVPGTYRPTLTVSNGITTSTATRTIIVTAPPGPIADFSVFLSSPTAPSTVSFTDTSTGSPTTWLWDFKDGSPWADATPPAKVYAAGTWSVDLTVTDAGGLTSTTTKTFTVGAAIPQCTVPPFVGLQTNVQPSIQSRWTTAGFDTSVIFNPSRPPNYTVTSQSLPTGASRPCAGTPVTVFR